MKKYLITVILIAGLLSVSAMLTVSPAEDEFTNLKILPKNISEEKLDMIMEHFKVSLGVKCSFCHAMDADTSKGHHLDFASDAKPEKLRAREMMQMTAYVNANFFNPDHSTQPDTIHTVMCYTCHRGNHSPDAQSLFPQLDSLIQLQQHHK